MSRRRAAEKREVLPDAKFHDLVISKFMNTLMERGKKSVAERVVYGALDEMQGKLKQDPVPAFHEALENVKPAVEVKSRRVGGAVVRNRWKRLLREAFRLSQSQLPAGLDIIAIPRPDAEPALVPLSDSLVRLASRAAKKLVKG